MAKHCYSIIEYYAEQEKNKCGYCKSPDTNFSHGMWAHSMTVLDYQALIDRGWRRSGSYCYKPTIDQICCPTYTIKCEALQFKVSKSQKKILKRMSKFLRNELQKDDLDAPKDELAEDIDMNNAVIPHFDKYCKRAQKNISEMNVSTIDSELNGKLIRTAVHRIPDGGEQSTEATSSCGSSSCNRSEGQSLLQGEGSSDLKPPCKKAKLLRIERKQSKLLAQGKSPKEIESMLKDSKQRNTTKSLEELFDELHSGTTKLELKLVKTSPMSSEYLKSSKASYEVYKKYETTIHKVPEEKVTENKYKRFLVKSPLQMKLVAVMSEEFLRTLEESAKLYKKYQMTIHGDRPTMCDEKSFLNFLVESPLQHWKPQDGPPQGYGSFHEQYWINNKLIAVGVIDILPLCISSVYFFYDPAYSQLSLGTFSSLREVYLTRQLNKVVNNLKYYYMGFYIHTCPKMRYKARMRPSKLLCPETYVWCDIEPALAKLDKEKYCRLNEDIDAVDQDAFVDINKILVLYSEEAMPYGIYKMRVHREITREEEDEVKEYAKLVGMKCAQSLLLYRSC